MKIPPLVLNTFLSHNKRVTKEKIDDRTITPSSDYLFWKPDMQDTMIAPLSGKHVFYLLSMVKGYPNKRWISGCPNFAQDACFPRDNVGKKENHEHQNPFQGYTYTTVDVLGSSAEAEKDPFMCALVDTQRDEMKKGEENESHILQHGLKSWVSSALLKYCWAFLSFWLSNADKAVSALVFKLRLQ